MNQSLGFLLSHLLPQRCQHVAKLGAGNVTVAILESRHRSLSCFSRDELAQVGCKRWLLSDNLFDEKRHMCQKIKFYPQFDGSTGLLADWIVLSVFVRLEATHVPEDNSICNMIVKLVSLRTE